MSELCAGAGTGSTRRRWSIERKLTDAAIDTGRSSIDFFLARHQPDLLARRHVQAAGTTGAKTPDSPRRRY